jgi:hypothetical protein
MFGVAIVAPARDTTKTPPPSNVSPQHMPITHKTVTQTFSNQQNEESLSVDRPRNERSLPRWIEATEVP